MVAAGVAAVAAVAAMVVVVLVGIAVLADKPPKTKESTAPVVGGDPPADLRLRDDQGSITITWTDPTSGTVPFIVAGGRTGQQLGALARMEPGVTTYTVRGFNSLLDYCFTVLAVYSTDTYATSGQVCTQRQNPPSPR
jgi:hypothetical protein